MSPSGHRFESCCRSHIQSDVVSIATGKLACGTVAQRSEHPAHNRRVVGSRPTRPTLFDESGKSDPARGPLHRGTVYKGCQGGIAQLGEHLLCTQGVKGSNPFVSTLLHTTGLPVLLREVVEGEVGNRFAPGLGLRP